MTLAEYEAHAARTTNTRLTKNERLLDAAAGLAEEAGEVLSLVRKHAFQSKALESDRIKEELGDALWCLAMTAHHAGMTLESIAQANVAKLRSRYPDGYQDRSPSEPK
ncbi:MAG TPA: nucleoside triphosphate pyrophosphohydrolase family protein [Gemmatimonadaceae bacterium]